ncbi:MAG: Rpp14/Pop5 family protein [Thermofilum sp.]
MKAKRRYVIIRCREGPMEPEKILARISEAVANAFGVVGLAHVNPRLVSREPGSLLIVSVNREGLDKLLAALLISEERSFEIIKVAGTVRRAARILASLSPAGNECRDER